MMTPMPSLGKFKRNGMMAKSSFSLFWSPWARSRWMPPRKLPSRNKEFTVKALPISLGTPAPCKISIHGCWLVLSCISFKTLQIPIYIYITVDVKLENPIATFRLLLGDRTAAHNSMLFTSHFLAVAPSIFYYRFEVFFRFSLPFIVDNRQERNYLDITLDSFRKTGTLGLAKLLVANSSRV